MVRAAKLFGYGMIIVTVFPVFFFGGSGLYQMNKDKSSNDLILNPKNSNYVLPKMAMANTDPNAKSSDDVKVKVSMAYGLRYKDNKSNQDKDEIVPEENIKIQKSNDKRNYVETSKKKEAVVYDVYLDDNHYSKIQDEIKKDQKEIEKQNDSK